jgi:hypothetical protein
MTPLYSILHATMGRPQKAVGAMLFFQSTANHPLLVEYSMCTTAGDPTFYDLAHGLKNVQMMDKFQRIHFMECCRPGSAAAWDYASKVASGDIMIQGQDDIEPPTGWDDSLIDLMVLNAGEKWREVPIYVAVSDGYRKDELCCTAIMNRRRMEQAGHFICGDYLSVYSDDEVTYRAKRDARDGKCIFINARDLVFQHRHHAHDSTVPKDATYEWENSAHAYNFGHGLFHQRNPDAIRDGLRNW